MTESIEKAVHGALFQAKDWLLGSLSDWLHWLVSWFLSSFGWGGVAALIAGTALLLTLSARAVKFLHSPRGMVASAAILFAGLACMWWFRPEPVMEKPGPMLASNRLAPPAPSTSTESASLPETPLLASKSEPFPAKKTKRQVEFQPMVFTIPPAADLPALLPPVVGVPHVSPPAVHQKPHDTTPAPRKPHDTAASANRHSVASRQAQGLTGAATGQQRLQQQSQQAHLQAQHRSRLAAQQTFFDYQLGLMLHHMAGNGMNGMGVHPGMGHAGAMGHHAGHR